MIAAHPALKPAKPFPCDPELEQKARQIRRWYLRRGLNPAVARGYLEVLFRHSDIERIGPPAGHPVSWLWRLRRYGPLSYPLWNVPWPATVPLWPFLVVDLVRRREPVGGVIRGMIGRR